MYHKPFHLLMNLKLNLVVVAAAALFFALPSVGTAQSKKKSDANDPKSLYNRLGGKAAITAVVDSTVAFIAADERINSFFVGTVTEGRVPALKVKLVDQICEATGGPCKYKGKNMKNAHRGMNLKHEHFTAFVENLVKALDHFKVHAKEKSDLLAALGPMESQMLGQ
jgi:hemoglobin